MTAATEHLVLQIGLKCHCKQGASCLRRCRRCKGIVARCGGHDKDMDKQMAEHCK